MFVHTSLYVLHICMSALFCLYSDRRSQSTNSMNVLQRIYATLVDSCTYSIENALIFVKKLLKSVHEDAKMCNYKYASTLLFTIFTKFLIKEEM
jgi:hypothetical protein